MPSKKKDTARKSSLFSFLPPAPKQPNRSRSNSESSSSRSSSNESRNVMARLTQVFEETVETETDKRLAEIAFLVFKELRGEGYTEEDCMTLFGTSSDVLAEYTLLIERCSISGGDLYFDKVGDEWMVGNNESAQSVRCAILQRLFMVTNVDSWFLIVS